LALLQQLGHFCRSLGPDHAELRRVTDRVGHHRALLGQQIAHLEQHQCRLLVDALDRHEAHPGSAHRLADRCGVDRIVLAALDVRLDGLRRQQYRLVPQAAQHPRPMVRGPARLDPDPRRRQLGEKLLDLAPPQLPAQNRLLALVDAVHLKDMLGCIQPDPDNRHRTASLDCGCDETRSLAQLMPSGAVHPNISAIGTGRSLSSGRPKAGPVGRCGEVVGAGSNAPNSANHVNDSEH
jgi:hypothetical protein